MRIDESGSRAAPAPARPGGHEGRPHPHSIPLDSRRRLYAALGALLVPADVALIVGSLGLGLWLRLFSPTLAPETPPWVTLRSGHVVMAGVVTAILVAFYAFQGLYRPEVYSLRTHQAFLLFRSITLAMLICVGLSFIAKSHVFMERRSILGVAWASLLVSEVLLRCVVLQRVIRHPRWRERVLVLGAGEGGQFLAAQLRADPGRGFDVVGYLDDEAPAGATVEGVPVLGRVDDLERLAPEHGVGEVFLGVSGVPHARLLDLIARARRARLGIRILSDLFDAIASKVRVETVQNIPLVRIREAPLSGTHRLLKRSMDLLGAGLGVVLLSPLLVLVALAVRLSSPGPVLFRQGRIGRQGRPFQMWKFRSMYTETDDGPYWEYARSVVRGVEAPVDDGLGGRVHKLPQPERVTPVGRWLRRFSLDELPQLVNVLRGELSLVGPRPHHPFEVEVYDEWHRRRLDVLPGMTGLWQVSGRERTGFEEMVLLDIYYIENWSLVLDLEILLRTIPVVLAGSRSD